MGGLIPVDVVQLPAPSTYSRRKRSITWFWIDFPRQLLDKNSNRLRGRFVFKSWTLEKVQTGFKKGPQAWNCFLTLFGRLLTVVPWSRSSGWVTRRQTSRMSRTHPQRVKQCPASSGGVPAEHFLKRSSSAPSVRKRVLDRSRRRIRATLARFSPKSARNRPSWGGFLFRFRNSELPLGRKCTSGVGSVA